MSSNSGVVDGMRAARVVYPHAVGVTADYNTRLQMALWLRTQDLNYLWVSNNSADLMHSGEFRFRRGCDATLFALRWSEHAYD